MSCGHSEDMLDQIQMVELTKQQTWECDDYPDDCDGQDPECKRIGCPWVVYSTIHDT